MQGKTLVIVLAVIGLALLGLSSLKHVKDCEHALVGGAAAESRPTYCEAKTRIDQQQRDQVMQNFERELVFECKTQTLPALPPDTQPLYQYAYYHDLHNLWDEKPGVWDGLAPYYRIAAANGDYKANIRLQYLLKEGYIHTQSAAEEIFALNQRLAEQLPATAYYNTYGAINTGHFTTEQEGQWSFLRKAAELGSAEAQYELSEVIMRIDDEATHAQRLAFSDKLRQCASENGYGEASQSYGVGSVLDKNFSEAVLAFQRGTRQGDNQSALWLESGFKFKADPNQPHQDVKDDLGLEFDAERAERYAKIQRYLSDKDYLNPKVPDLDEIVPLPPAKLPPWDGRIAFQRWYEGPSPAQPSAELMQRLADAQGLEVKTGQPLHPRPTVKHSK